MRDVLPASFVTYQKGPADRAPAALLSALLAAGFSMPIHRRLVRFFISSWVFCILACVTAASTRAQYLLLNQEVILSRLKAAPQKDTDREAEVGKMFREAGCQPTEQPVKGLRQPNIICILPGTSDSVILVGAHFDHADEGDGIIDDWSGVSLLPSLYQSLAGTSRSHTLVFVGFGGEEKGMVGSEFYVKHLTPEQRKQIVAMVNLECLGVSPTKIWASHSEPFLISILLAVTHSLQLTLSGVDVEKVGTTDSESFAHYKIPRITIHSITQERGPYFTPAATILRQSTLTSTTIPID
jgi:peptidase M28-like protein